MALRVFLVDDAAQIRSSLSAILGGWPDIDLVGMFDCAEAALSAVRGGLRADVALIDLGLPDMAGHELIRSLKALDPKLDAVVLSVFTDEDRIFDALRAGACGYLVKDTPPQQLVDALQQAASGGAPMSPVIARKVVAAFQDAAADDPLSPREREVLLLLTRGLTYEEIGHSLSIAIGTVQAHIKSIYRKLEVCSKAEATAEAARRGWLRSG